MTTPAEGAPSPETQIDQTVNLRQELLGLDAFCVHAIRPIGSGNNRLLPINTSVGVKFGIALAHRPPLEASVMAAQAATNAATLWGNAGLLIADGVITHASPGDASSVARSMTERTTRKIQTPEQIIAGLRTAVQYSRQKGSILNEVNISSPVWGGLCFRDTSGLQPGYDYNPDELTTEPSTIPPLLLALHEQTGLPIFALRHPGLFRIEQYQEDGSYKLWDCAKVTPKEIEPAIVNEAWAEQQRAIIAGLGILTFTEHR